MSYTVGLKGQIVINQEIRKALGITPGSQTIQRVVGDHLEIRFLPPEHSRSLKGILRPYIRRRPDDPDTEDESWPEEAARHYRETLPE